MKVKFVCRNCKNPCKLKIKIDDTRADDITMPFECPFACPAKWERVEE